MKFIVIVLIIVSMMTSSHASQLQFGSSWEEDVEILVDLARNSFKGFMSKFHFTEEYPVHDKCLGFEFTIHVQEIIKIIREREEDYILKTIKIFERLGHMYDISEKHCDVNKLVSEIDAQCSKVGCDYFKLFLRGQSHTFDLIQLYKEIIQLLNKRYKDLDDAEEGFKQIGEAWAKGFHIMLAMK